MGVNGLSSLVSGSARFPFDGIEIMRPIAELSKSNQMQLKDALISHPKLFICVDREDY